MTGDELQILANRQGAGHLKVWKAVGMVLTLKQLPGILEDKDRLLRFVRNCLAMEGFTETGIQQVAEALYKDRHEDNKQG